ncbi:MAG: TolC family protein [Cytophagales bacterium]|nr:TolC family protein [Cytophagales bacterium]
MTIAVVYDSPADKNSIDSLFYEINLLVGDQYQLNAPLAHAYSINNSEQVAKNVFSKLEKNPDIYAVLAKGPIASDAMARTGTYRKPSIAMNILSPELQGLGNKEQSGIPNFTYISASRDIRDDLKELKKVHSFKKLGIIVFGKILDQLGIAANKTINIDSVSDFTLFKYTSNTNALWRSLQARQIDAAILSLKSIPKKNRFQLIDFFNKKKFPCFSFYYNDVANGALATLSPKTYETLLNRRCALDIEAILSGTSASTLSTTIKEHKEMTINIQTAHRLGAVPDYSVLIASNLINDFNTQGTLSLKEAIHEAIGNNPDLKAGQDAVDISRKNYKIAANALFPNLTLSGQQTFNDPRIASFSSPERSFAGVGQLNQLLYSEETMANLRSQQLKLKAQQQEFQSLALNTVMSTAQAYLNVLIARANSRIQNSNRELTKTSLELAKLREEVGYSGLSDVYRWESELARATNEAFRAYAQTQTSEAQLNQLLNRPVNQIIRVNDIHLAKTKLLQGVSGFEQYMKNPFSVDILLEFLQAIALEQAPELEQFELNKSIQHRLKKSNSRQRYLPSLSSSGQYHYRFYQEGTDGMDLPAGSTPKGTWNIGLNLNLPVFQGGSISTKNQRYKTALQQLENQKTAAEQQIRTQVYRAVRELNSNYFNLNLSRQASLAASNGYTLVQEAYQKGKADYVTLLDAQNAKIQAALSEASAEYQFLLSWFSLERSISRFSLLHTREENQAFFQRFQSFYLEKKP